MKMMQRCIVSGWMLWAFVGAQIVFPDSNSGHGNRNTGGSSGFDPCRLCPCNGGSFNIPCPPSCCSNSINRPIQNTPRPSVNRPSTCAAGCFQCFRPGQGQASCGSGCCRNTFTQPTVAPVQSTCPSGCFQCFRPGQGQASCGSGCCRNNFVQAPPVTLAPTCPANCFSCNVPIPGVQTSCGQQGCCRNIPQPTAAPPPASNQCSSSSCSPCASPTIVDQITCGFSCCIKTGRLSADVNQLFGGKEYHFSWLHDGNQKYTQQQAASYCARLPGGWRIISIETRAEDNFVNNIITTNRLDYIWTGATRTGAGWRWPSGAAFQQLNWSTTGGAGIPQPDNREPGGENCLAVLNNVYNDGVKWHDIGCSHPKPTICER